MGPWNSDGTFGYSSVSLVTVGMAAEARQDPNLMAALSRLMQTQERTRLFIELLETFGPALTEGIVAVYRERSLDVINATRLAPRQPKRETRNVSVASAAG